MAGNTSTLDLGNVRIDVVNGAAVVSDTANPQGIVRTRYVSVTGDTAPIVATSGVLTYTAPGARGHVINSVRIVSGHAALLALVVAGTANLDVRVGIDNASDAAALALLPDTYPSSSATTDHGQIEAFSLIPIIVSAVLDATRVVYLKLPARKVYLDVTSPITRLDFVHELAGVVLQFQVSAVEEV